MEIQLEILMCGILGIFNLNGKPIDPIQLQRMTDIMSHRGPDGRGFLLADAGIGKTLFFDKDCPLSELNFTPTIGLGHRRLSIIDLTTGQQPMCNEDGTVWITFNGEIYNFFELRQELQKKGHYFKTSHSDTETIIHAYEEWGEECLQRFSGMFAFGIIDLNKRELFLARDRPGKKPLYYYHDGEKFIFASEMKAILEDASVPREIDITSLADYLSYQYVPSPKTIFKNIYKLKPRHYILANFESITSPLTQRQYWNIQFNPDESISESEWCERLRAELTRAIKIRMISDVPLGVFLSGGVDSSTIVALMSGLQEEPIKTFSIGFDEEERNELPYARQVAQKYNTEHYEEIVRPDAIDVLPKLVWQYDEPFGDDYIPTYYVSQMARKHVTVALGGDGADELFAGYTHYETALKHHNQFDRIPYFVRKIAFGSLAYLIPENIKGKNMATLLSKRDFERIGYMMGASKWKKLLRRDIIASLDKEYDHQLFTQYWDKVKELDYVTQMQYADLNVYLPECILVKVDKASMLNSLEIRSPFLDHKFIELTARIPSRFKLNGYDKKYILKRMMLEELGRDFLYRRKTGFSMPLDRWFRNDLMDYTRNQLLDTESFVRHYIDNNVIVELLEKHQRGIQNSGMIIWRLLCLECWGRIYKPDV